MSKKRAKQLRRLERRVWELERLLSPEIKNYRAKALQEEKALNDLVDALDAEWMPEEPRKGILRRIVGFFRGR